MFYQMKIGGDFWIDAWLNPLLAAMEEHPEAQGFQGALVNLLEQRPDAMKLVELWCQREPARLGVHITALLACRRHGLVLDSLPKDLMERALRHSDDQVRFLIFHLID